MTIGDLTRKRRSRRAGLVGLPLVCLASVSLFAATGGPDAAPAFTDVEMRRIEQHADLGPPPPDPTNAKADDPAAARLGHRLFFDQRLSADAMISCATCHDPATGFSDGHTLAEGLGVGTRHTPSLWNVAYNRWFFWDGRSDSLWAQALGPVERPVEMGASRLQAVHLVVGDDDLRRSYESVFGPLPDLSDTRRFPVEARPVPDAAAHPHQVAWDAMTPADRETVNRVFANIGKAIAAYERRLVSRASPFDRFVEGLRSGDPAAREAMSPSAVRGLRLFVGRGQCRLCHGGPGFTDGEFHDNRVPPLAGGLPRDTGRFGGVPDLLADPFNAVGVYSDDRTGPAARRLEFLVNGPENWGRFKTPGLRNVALSPPYMHQGQFATLREVIEYYSTLEGATPAGHHAETILRPREFTEQEIDDLVAFLESLTDTGDPEWVREPGGAEADR